MSDFEYNDGDGLEVLDPTRPDDSIDPMSVMGEAIKQIKAYLKDEVAGPLAEVKKGLWRTGTVMIYAGTVLPDGWLWCDGAEHEVEDYTDLYNHLWGQGYIDLAEDGKFKVIDMTDRVPIGVQTLPARVEPQGALAVALTAEQMPPHTHRILELIPINYLRFQPAPPGPGVGRFVVRQNQYPDAPDAMTEGEDPTLLNVTQPSLLINYIIKT